MLTFAKARIVDTKKSLKNWCREQEFDYTRISKLINRTRGYTATQDESHALSRWLDIPEDLLFEDAWRVLQEHTSQHLRLQRRKKPRPNG